MGWDLVRTHTRRSLVRHHAGAVGPTEGAGSWLWAAPLAEAGLRVLEKKSAVVQRLFQWVGIWCVYTHDIALSDTMQGRWDLRRARGCGYRQVRVPGASAGDSSCATAGIEPNTRLTIRTEVGINSRWHHAANAATSWSASNLSQAAVATQRGAVGARRTCSGASLVA